jgi:hypothetical protein
MAQTITITAVPLDRHGYNISCCGEKDGAIDITVTGGTPPYKYAWSNGSRNEDVQDLPAGFYAVLVTDAISQTARIEVILTEPDPLKPYIVPYEYPNGYNISCYNCYNGSLDLVPVGGATPYTYQWYDGPTTEDRSLLGSDNFGAVVTDANGCTFKTEQVYLRAPDRSDWTMSGNAGTNPTTQYLGTSDNKDVVFKSNGQERLRLNSDGALKATSLAFDHGYRLLMVDSTGQLKLLTDHNANNAPLATTCYDHGSNLPWTFCGNIVFPTARLGTRNNVPLRLISNDQERLILMPNGKVGIGTSPPAGPVGDYRLFVENGISTRDVLVKVGDWPDYVFVEGYHLMPLGELRDFLNTNRHLPGVPSVQDVADKKGVEVGDLQAKMLKVMEEQALYILQLEERLQRMEAILETLKGIR